MRLKSEVLEIFLLIGISGMMIFMIQGMDASSLCHLIYWGQVPVIDYAEDYLKEAEDGEKRTGIADWVIRQAGEAIPVYQFSLSLYDGQAQLTQNSELLQKLEEENSKKMENGSALDGADDAAVEGDDQDRSAAGIDLQNKGGQTSEEGTQTADAQQAEDGLMQDSAEAEEPPADTKSTSESTEEAGKIAEPEENGETVWDFGNFQITRLEEVKRVDASILNTPKIEELDLDAYSQEDFLKTFYTIDTTTKAPAELQAKSELIKTNLQMTAEGDEPQILIYHTHSQEGYQNGGTVVDAGNVLTNILQEEYGYNVLHHTGEYDVAARDYAYSYALPALQKLLAEYPSIEVIIDLHRDAVSGASRLVANIGGAQTAQFMFFNGLSYMNDVGKISYLPNENLRENLAFSLHMQKVCGEYYPGITRKIYLKGYRYNMHLRGKSLLVELGAQNNTLEEAENACWPLARALHLVLSGQE